jgi:hypothetical protein
MDKKKKFCGKKKLFPGKKKIVVYLFVLNINRNMNMKIPLFKIFFLIWEISGKFPLKSLF